MRNIKDEVVAKLDERFGEDHVKDEYPLDWSTLPVILITEEQNRVYEYCEKGEKLVESKAQVRFRIDIYDKKSTSVSAANVDDVLGLPGLGLKRTACNDVHDPGGYKHKLMLFEGIIDMENDLVEWIR